MEPSLFNWCQIICEFVFLFFLFALFCDIIGITYRKVRKREKKPLNISLFFSSNKPAVHYIVIAVLLVGVLTLWTDIWGGSEDFREFWQKKAYTAYYDGYVEFEWSGKGYSPVVVEIEKFDGNSYYIQRIYFENGYIENTNGDFLAVDDLDEKPSLWFNEHWAHLDIQDKTWRKKIPNLPNHELSTLEFLSDVYDSYEVEAIWCETDQRIHADPKCSKLSGEWAYDTIDLIGLDDSNFCSCSKDIINEKFAP